MEIRGMIEKNNRFACAMEYAQAHEIDWSRDTTGHWGVHQQDPAPFNVLFGPVHPRGGVCAVVAQKGEIIASFGQTSRADLTFSVAKAYLALLAGVAFDRHMLNPNQTISSVLPGIGFDDEHNRHITWQHLLQQTSEWSGTCLGMPDVIEHNRSLAFAPAPPGIKGEARALNEPGTYWEYNDVRINQLSLALLHLFKKPLPDVFRQHIAIPCGLSSDWRWVGYDHAWIEIDGMRMPSVPGGSHWGAGVSISAEDQLKLTELMRQNGVANGIQIISRQWLDQMRTPCAIASFYGYLIWLNSAQRILKSVSSEAYFGMGAGGHFSLVEPKLDLSIVVRWLDQSHADGFFERIVDALR
jgi:CubicO group peptidase (beta-lactamase class C family)